MVFNGDRVSPGDRAGVTELEGGDGRRTQVSLTPLIRTLKNGENGKSCGTYILSQ